MYHGFSLKFPEVYPDQQTPGRRQGGQDSQIFRIVTTNLTALV